MSVKYLWCVRAGLSSSGFTEEMLELQRDIQYNIFFSAYTVHACNKDKQLLLGSSYLWVQMLKKIGVMQC